jgi:uncharacterized membrane protein
MRKWYPVLVVLLAVAASAAVYGRLPERMPTHWNVTGEVDGYGSRLEGALLLPATIALMAALVPVLPRIDPRRRNYDKFRPTYHLVMNAVLTFMLGMHLVLLASGLGWRVPVERVVAVGVGLLLVLLGNVLPRTRSNWMLGIRTPWTLSSDRVWERTHRVGGYLLVGAGVVAITGALLPDPRAGFVALGAGVLAAALGSVAYSYVAWRQ